MSEPTNKVARNAIIVAAIALFALHQDLWFWHDDRVVLGFMPIGLAYHAAYSIAASLLWAFAVRFAWPHTIEAEAEQAADSSARDIPNS